LIDWTLGNPPLRAGAITQATSADPALFCGHKAAVPVYERPFPKGKLNKLISDKSYRLTPILTQKNRRWIFCHQGFSEKFSKRGDDATHDVAVMPVSGLIVAQAAANKGAGKTVNDASLTIAH
jgi:hypothetical protein